MNRCVAILGATGLVGRTMLALLESRAFPARRVRLLASERSTLRSLPFRGQPVPVEPVSVQAFEGVDLALFAAANPVAEAWAEVARAAGARVVDNSSAFRYRADVPLVVPEVNPGALEGRPTLIANPNCSTIGVVMALAPLLRAARFERLVVATYQAVSGAGAEALETLEHGIRAGLEGGASTAAQAPPAFAYNVIPHIDRFEDNGYTREEMKMVWETRKILALPDLPISVTAVRVPVRVGHCAAVHLTLDREMTPAEARALWSSFPGVWVEDDPAAGGYPTPLRAAGRDEVLVGRARRDLSAPRSLAFFVASDNLRKGAALNAVQIAEALDRVEATAR